MANKVRVKRIIKGKDYSIDKNQDSLRKAGRKGWRKSNSNAMPTRKEIQEFYDGKRNDIYMESRPNRSDFSTRAKKGERFDKGGSVNQNDIKDLANGYKSAILFTSTDEDDTELDSNYSVSDFDKKSNDAIEKMAEKYISENLDAIKESGLEYDQIGMDIWYAQSGAGAGFFDRELDKDVEEKLTKGAKKFGDLSHHVFAQDGKVYLEGMKFALGGEVKNRTSLTEEEKQFVREESQDAGQGYTYRAKVLRGAHIILKEKDGQPIQKFTVDNSEVASKMSAMLNKANDKEKMVKLESVKFTKGGEIKRILVDAMDEGESFSDDMKVMFEYKNGRLGITKFFGKNREKSNKTVINNASDLSLEELEEKVKIELPKLKLEKLAKGGKIEEGREFRYLKFQKVKNGLKISLTDEGKEMAEEDGLTFRNFYDFFEDVNGNSEYMYVEDGGEAGFGMTQAPMILDGYHYAENGEIETDYPESAEAFYDDNYMIKDFAEVLKRDSEFTFTELSNKMAKGGKVDRTKSIKKTRVDRTKKYAKGGHVSKGELVWNKLSNSNKLNFLNENFTPQITPRSQEILVGKTFNFLPKNVKIKIESKYANIEEYAKGGGVGKNKLTYEIKEMPAYNQLDEEVGKWYRIYDNKGRLKTLFTRNRLNSDSKYSVTEVGDKLLAEKILDEIKSGKHNEDKIVKREADYFEDVDLKNYSSKDLPKDGSNIYIYMPEHNKLPEGYSVFRHNKSHGMFDLFVDEKLVAIRIDEKSILDNLNNGVYVLKNEEDYNKFNKLEELEDGKFAKGGGVGEIKVGDFIRKKGSNLELKVLEIKNDKNDSKEYVIIYNDVTDSIQAVNNILDYELVKFAKGGAIKEVDFENSNIVFYGFSHDKNGNSVVKFGFPNQSAFSLQTNDPSWFRFTKGKYTKNIGELEPSDIIKIEEEIVEYIKNFGSKKQKDSLKIYSKFKGGVRDVKEVDALLQDAIKKTKDLSAKEIADMWNKNINTEISKSWDEEEVTKNISHFRSYLKDLLFEKQLTEAEYSAYFKDGGEINFRIQSIISNKGMSVVKDSIVKSIRDFKQIGDTKSEILEAIENVYGSYFIPFTKTQIDLIYKDGGTVESESSVKNKLTLSEIESKLNKTFSFWTVPYEVSVDGNIYRKILNKSEYRKI